jgi:ADP-ribose pyrophosphatase YjhB (NUDIX family)
MEGMAMTDAAKPNPPGEWKHKSPRPTVDSIVVRNGRVLLVRRKWPPPGFALPGGFVDVGETLEQAVCRETLEETALNVTRLRQLHVYSDPKRDPRQHTIGTIFECEADGEPIAGDDAAAVQWFALDELPPDIAFDHRQILEDYKAKRYPGGFEAAPS